MTKHFKKFIFFCVILVFAFSIFNMVFAQGLEVTYPTVPGTQEPTTTGFNIAQYIRYIYYFFIGISGVLALLFLVLGGVALLTSAGNPNKLSEARKRIFSALLGIFILFSSYLILVNINPNLVRLEPPTLTQQSLTTFTPPTTTLVPDILGRIEEIANNTIISINGLENSSRRIEDLTDNCDCAETQSLCACDGSRVGSFCEPIRAYADERNQPCPETEEIKEAQKDVVAWKEELFYYKNRAFAEEFDLRLSIVDLEVERDYYQNELATETNADIISFYNEEISSLIEEINLKEVLATELNNLGASIYDIEFSALELSKLPERCLEGVADYCIPSCKTGGNYGCFDVLNGCVPGPVDSGNPCPLGEIRDRSGEIQSSRPGIENNSNRILNQIQEIIKFKTITI